MSLKRNMAVVRKMNEALNKQDPTVLNEFVAPDYVDHTSQRRGPKDVKQFYTRAFRDFPDFDRIVEDIIAE